MLRPSIIYHFLFYVSCYFISIIDYEQVLPVSTILIYMYIIIQELRFTIFHQQTHKFCISILRVKNSRKHSSYTELQILRNRKWFIAGKCFLDFIYQTRHEVREEVLPKYFQCALRCKGTRASIDYTSAISNLKTVWHA